MTPITIARLSLAYLIPTLIGIVILSGLERGKRRLAGFEKLALGFAIGSGIVSFYLFYLGILRIRFNFWTLTAIVWLFIIWGIFIYARIRPKKLAHSYRSNIFSSKTKWKEKLLITFLVILLIWKIFFIAFNVVVSAPYFDDSVSCWNYKAKVYFHTRRIIWDRKDPDFLGGHPGRTHYPNGIPLFKSWVALWMGRWEDLPVNVNTLIFWLCLGLLFYFNLRYYLSASVAFAFTYMLLSIPLITFHAGFAYFDMVAGFYFIGGIIYLYRWIERREDFYLVLSALLFAIGLSIKEEMLAFFVLGVIPVLVIYQAAAKFRLPSLVRNTALYLSIVFVPSFPWFYAKANYRLQLGPVPATQQLEFNPKALKLLVAYFFDFGNYNILWTLLIAGFVFSFHYVIKSNLKYLLLSLVFALAFLLGAFLFVRWTFNRATLIVMPLMIYYLALIYGKLSTSRCT
ncbi:MAG: hypothetical protein RAO92_02865 [Candidatus Euphemobacter frigidus]|nr:hypothetical protein [Candidatus Euphemobacter frigidus]MDP8275321.1 hypothetical protein [Candidatus Euphemobacter frigidus]